GRPPAAAVPPRRPGRVLPAVPPRALGGAVPRRLRGRRRQGGAARRPAVGRNWSGADLFKNGVSVFFMLAHRNQRSLTLDLKHPEGRAVARRLVERADVLVQNFRPGVMARHGLDWETAKAINPRLIYVSASGYGEPSPYRDRPGQDLLMQGLSGLASISGRADQPPT